MPDNVTFGLAVSADRLGVKPITLRRWAIYHQAYLSPLANPLPGVPRRFSQRDITVLQTVAELRDQGITVAGINDRLADLTFPEIDEPNPIDQFIDNEDTTEITLPDAPESPHSTQAIIQLLSSHQAQMDAIQQAVQQTNRQQIDRLTMLGIGICIGLLFCAILIGLAWLYGG